MGTAQAANEGLFKDLYGYTAALTSNSATQLEYLGRYRAVTTDGQTKIYKYVQADASVVGVAAGDVVAYMDAADWDNYTVTDDISDTKANLVAGVAVGTLTASYYGWIQVYGYHATVTTNGDDDIAGGESVIMVGDGTLDSVAAGTAPTYKVLGWATGADDDANDDCPVFITCFP
jgi:hypothetical protein